MFKNLLVRAGTAILAVAVMLVWWSIRGSDSNSTEVKGIPERVWAGGAGKLTVEVETTTAATMRVSFSEEKEDGTGKSIHSHEEIPAGTKSWTIDVPAGVGGYVEITAINPQVGATLKWRILLNGQVVDEQSEALEKPLEPNWSFGLQQYFADYSKGTKEED